MLKGFQQKLNLGELHYDVLYIANRIVMIQVQFQRQVGLSCEAPLGVQKSN